MSRSNAAAQVRDAAPLFAALGDDTRLHLLTRLSAGGPRSIAQLADKSPVTRQAVTKHLEVLHRAGIVRSSKRGRERIWEVTPERLATARGYLDTIARQWDDALDRLKTFVEEG